MHHTRRSGCPVSWPSSPAVTAMGFQVQAQMPRPRRRRPSSNGRLRSPSGSVNMKSRGCRALPPKRGSPAHALICYHAARKCGIREKSPDPAAGWFASSHRVGAADSGCPMRRRHLVVKPAPKRRALAVGASVSGTALVPRASVNGRLSAAHGRIAAAQASVGPALKPVGRTCPSRERGDRSLWRHG